MKNAIKILLIIVILISCKDDDINLFDKTADQRAAEAIATLKADLTAPENGWKVKYKPVDEAGSYFVLMDFDENNKVRIRTDMGANNGEFFDQTISYRIDNSLGLELIFENYSFFSFLFEQDQASFGAEYEFNFVNKTPDNLLVFSSKTDLSDPTIILFEEAASSDASLLGLQLAENLNILADDIDKISSSFKLTYEDRDLIFYLSMDDFRRTVDFKAASRKTNLNESQVIDFATGYVIKGDSLILESPLTGSFFGNNISLLRIKFNDLTETSINICTTSIAAHTYSGVTSSNDYVILETSLTDLSGAAFSQVSNFYFAPLQYIVQDGLSVGSKISQDVAGALEMHMYYGLPLNNGSTLYGIGFVIQNLNGSTTFALREFTPVINENKITFNFKPTITLFGSMQTDANIDNINKYLDPIAEGNNTYVFEIGEDIYEFHNPCTGWSIVFINGNR